MAWVEGEDGKIRCSMCESPKGAGQWHFNCVCNIETVEEYKKWVKEGEEERLGEGWTDELGDDEE